MCTCLIKYIVRKEDPFTKIIGSISLSSELSWVLVDLEALQHKFDWFLNDGSVCLV